LIIKRLKSAVGVFDVRVPAIGGERFLTERARNGHGESGKYSCHSFD